ncbi:hypothetical protein CXB51_019930 [Gossypium anomalum]|uniref:DUF4219 domain-containing protein n=1 Tax=Gossypium anomalum TaxID=47600 RepID=A0A8J5YQ14_9ROSI|nr:hypothetical protein CXB51_019930 [Gossypium anomalum]
MAMIPRFFGNRRSSIFDDPFSFDILDPFKGFPLSFSSLTTTPVLETATFANTRIDWKETPEAHVFKADLPGLKKEEVKWKVHEEVQVARKREDGTGESFHGKGVLTVTVPKEEVKKPDLKSIEISVAASMSFSPPPPPIFTGKNYNIWAVKMRTYLQAHDLWNVVQNDTELPPLRANPTIAQIRQHN